MKGTTIEGVSTRKKVFQDKKKKRDKKLEK